MAALLGEYESASCNDNILDLSSVLLYNLIFERFCRKIDRQAEETLWLQIQLSIVDLSDPRQQRLAKCLMSIADELDGDENIQKMLNNPTLQLTPEVFNRMAHGIFSDGKLNWGRVVVLFYFACQLALKATECHSVELIRNIVSWTLFFIKKYIFDWIKEQGGWDGIWSYFGTPTWQTVGVFLAGVLSAVLVIWKM